LMPAPTAAVLAIDGGTPVRRDFLPYHQPLITAADEQAVLETLRSGWLTTGPRTKGFERELARYTRSAHCVAVNSCTAALHLALQVCGVGPGDEVVTSPITFASTANVIVHCGATPVFADVDADTVNLDPAALAAAITARTRAVIAVDFAGHPCDYDAILPLARAHDIAVIEDAAHAIGAAYRGQPVGGVADLTAFSFYATKNITSGEGGALTTNRADWAEQAAILSLHGISRDAWKRYTAEGYRHWDIIAPGYKYNMFDLQAALVSSQLARIAEFQARRAVLKARFDAAFGTMPELQLLGERPGVTHAYHLYPVVFSAERLTVDRDAIMNALQAENIGIGVHFRAVHLHPYYVERFRFARGMFPRAEYYSDRAISLPLYPKLTDREADDVIDAVRKVVTRFRR
jgi:dTDP-4-amino-4,6-dideoxygalactose transaminase